MKKQLGLVEEFHRLYRLNVSERPTVDLPPEIIELRHRLMSEENDEYLSAARSGDLVEVADALGDMLYILCGTMLEHGLQDKMEEIFDEIHRSNLSKLDENGQPLYREDGKVIKGASYFKPEIARILNRK